ncbi:MAG: hypothetical protein H6712_08235 [Myxococcales bacterium]|nr:hypothetical protein [Myxococcales bacterium]MCB9713826.1 hypothetical protein [Myxococcales bacterium]
MAGSSAPSPAMAGGLAPLALLLALAGLLATDLDAVDEGMMRGAIGRDLVRIADLASLRGTEGSAGPTATMPVTVIPEGGPGWLGAAAEAAVEADPVFTSGEPHLLRVDLVEHARCYGVRSQLWRQGWSLRAPDPLWVTPAPWVALLSLLAGAGWAGLRRRLAGGLALAGVLAQLLVLALPWPPGFARPSLQDRWHDGPLGHAVVELARALPDASVAIGAGVVTLCLVLMIFDHRRSSEAGGGVVAAGMLGVLGALAWLEAALRVGLVPWVAQPAGWLALVGAAGLWAWAGRRRSALERERA